MLKQHVVFIAGAGGIGAAVGLIMAEKPLFPVKIYIGDIDMETASQSAKWINEGVGAEVVFPVLMSKAESNEQMDKVLAESEIILDCLPGSQAPRMASLAAKFDLHYANLTEYVKETNEVIEIAKKAKKGFVLQTGLAPGFINILGHKLFKDFTAENKVDKVDSLSMKVGALTRYAEAPHYYGFTWSPVGVATEYLKDCVAVRDFEKVMLPPLSELGSLIIDGVHYEDNLTSGGAADLPDALAGKVRRLDYKTIRYPGHYTWVRKILSEVPVGENTISYLQKTMQENIPSVKEDMVIVYAAVEGKDEKGILRGHQKAYTIYPSQVGNKTLRAIQTTTAAPLAEVAFLLLKSKDLQGPIFQSQLDIESFLNGPFVAGIYG